MFDVRQHSLLRLFQAHNGQINNIIINDSSEYFVTGSVDGIIKVILLIKFYFPFNSNFCV